MHKGKVSQKMALKEKKTKQKKISLKTLWAGKIV